MSNSHHAKKNSRNTETSSSINCKRKRLMPDSVPSAAVASSTTPLASPSSNAASSPASSGRLLLLSATLLVLLSRIHPVGSPTSSNVSYQRRLSEHFNRKRMAADAEKGVHRHGSTRKFAVVALAAQVVFILLFFVYVDYDDAALPAAPRRVPAPNDSTSTVDAAVLLLDQMLHHGTVFQETFFFIVSGFGLIYCFVSRYNYSCVGESMLITAIAAQWGMLCKGFLYSATLPMKLGVFSLMGGIGVACAVLVTWGVLLGKLSPLQLVLLIMIEVPVLVGTEWIAITVLQVKDVGGSMLVHQWGAYFGVAVTTALYRPEFEDETNLPVSPTADFRSLIGTLILWVFWPTCVASPLVGSERLRTFINVYTAMMGSCVATFVASSLLDKDGKFGMFHIQNATIAGAIAVGTAADMLIGPGGCLIAGMVGAIVTIVGINYLQPAMTNKLRVHDTAGVHNLHGLVGLVGGITGAIITAMATEDRYGYGLYTVFPAMAPQSNTTDYVALQEIIPHLVPGLGRNGLEQAGYQLATLILCFLVPMLSGTLTGFILRTPFCDFPTVEMLYLDDAYWRLPEPASDDDHSSIHTISRPASTKEKTHKNNAVAPL